MQLWVVFCLLQYLPGISCEEYFSNDEYWVKIGDLKLPLVFNSFVFEPDDETADVNATQKNTKNADDKSREYI